MGRFAPPPETVHGIGSVDTIQSELDRRGWEDVHLIGDEGVADAGILGEIRGSLAGDPPAYTDVTPNPDVDTVYSIREAIEGAAAVIAVGGGSVMDAAKAATALPAFERASPPAGSDTGSDRESAFEALHQWPVQQPAPDPDAAIPLILVPTTAGTGTETGHWAVISDHERGEKLSVGHPTLGAELAVLDATLTTTLPEQITAGSGFDVLAHAIEALVATGGSPLTRPNARVAFDVAFDRLPVVARDGSNVDARADMLAASYLAGVAMNNAGLGAVHAISHGIGGKYDTPHGHTNALLLPAVVERNAADDRGAFATYAELTGDTDRPGQTLAAELETLRRTVGLPSDLPDLPDDPDWEAVAAFAVENINMETNPTAYSRDTVVELCEKVFG